MKMIMSINILTLPSKNQTCSQFIRSFKFWKLLIGSLVFILSTAQANAQERIDCPLPEARRTVTNALPDGWWTTPIVNRLSGTRVANIGGKLALICEYGTSGSVQRNAPAQANCQSATGGFRCVSSSTTDSCETALQGKIAWNYKGDKKWAKENIAQLCKGEQSSVEPALCFRDVLHTGVNWGKGTRWQWQNAIKLCAGSQDAGATISCFRMGIGNGKSWDEAADFCSP